jgi:hypothetical protein
MVIDESERKILNIRTSEVWGQTAHYLDLSGEDCEVIAKACNLDSRMRRVLDKLVLAVIRAEKEAMDHIGMIMDGIPRNTIRPANPGKK